MAAMIDEISVHPDAAPVAGRLAAERVLISGAGGALGSALAERAGAEGAELVLLDKDLAALESLHDRIEAAGHRQPALYPLDMLGASPDDYAELASRLEQELGGLDSLVHAAADPGEPAPLGLYDPQSWLKCLHVNINAGFLLTQSLLGLLRASHGRVVFVSDEAGRSGRAALGAYAVSKWAVEGIMATLAAEYSAAHPVIGCSVDPGALQSGLRRALFTGETAQEVAAPAAAASAIAALLDPARPPRNGARYRVVG